MTAARKPPPTHIYREEIHGAEPGYNSTRQTFDRKKFEEWRSATVQDATSEALYDRFGWERRFYVGRVEWERLP